VSNLATTEPGVDQQAGILMLQIGAITAGTAAKNCKLD